MLIGSRSAGSNVTISVLRGQAHLEKTDRTDDSYVGGVPLGSVIVFVAPSRETVIVNGAEGE
jgi:hypothetical protein